MGVGRAGATRCRPSTSRITTLYVGASIVGVDSKKGRGSGRRILAQGYAVQSSGLRRVVILKFFGQDLWGDPCVPN